MHYIISIFFIFFILNSSTAQVLSDVYISYSIDIDSDKPAASMLTLGSTLELAFRDSRTKARLKLAGGTNSIAVVVDHKTKTGTNLMDVLDGKKAVKIKTEKYDNALLNIKKISDNPMRHTDDYKIIAGYSCQKVFMKHLESGANVIVYVTDKIFPGNDPLAKSIIGQIKGYPLGLVIRKDDSTVRIMADKVSSRTPSASVFSLSVPEDYKLTTFEELKENFDQKRNENR
ncbi:MAG: hypothetical protein MK207_09480 [Saprospiraceae bacterium]|nr:hypothetical protein [Saprospiraceae bacterium]